VTKIYTRKGDDGTTGLLYGGRVKKGDPQIDLNGDIDEAQAAIGLARSRLKENQKLNELLSHIERDLWVVMGEVACYEKKRELLKSKNAEVSEEMVKKLEVSIDFFMAEVGTIRDFTIPGESPGSAYLDFARTIVRRAERKAYNIAQLKNTLIGPYLNRLSDLLWALARYTEPGTIKAKEIN
jgi:cob(I)alamin adenosyltransferase